MHRLGLPKARAAADVPTSSNRIALFPAPSEVALCRAARRAPRAGPAGIGHVVASSERVRRGRSGEPAVRTDGAEGVAHMSQPSPCRRFRRRSQGTALPCLEPVGHVDPPDPQARRQGVGPAMADGPLAAYGAGVLRVR